MQVLVDTLPILTPEPSSSVNRTHCVFDSLPRVLSSTHTPVTPGTVVETKPSLTRKIIPFLYSTNRSVYWSDDGSLSKICLETFTQDTSDAITLSTKKSPLGGDLS